MCTLLHSPALDNPGESRRSFASTAFPEDFDHADYQDWIDSHNAAMAEAEEAVAHAEYLADTVQDELDASARIRPAPSRATILIHHDCEFPNRRVRRAWVAFIRTLDPKKERRVKKLRDEHFDRFYLRTGIDIA